MNLSKKNEKFLYLKASFLIVLHADQEDPCIIPTKTHSRIFLMCLATTQDIHRKTKSYESRFYKSEIKVLAHTWLESREVWKSKCKRLGDKLKSHKNEVKNLVESRDLYKQKYKQRQIDYHEVNRQYKKKSDLNSMLKEEMRSQSIKIRKLEEVVNKKNNQLDQLNTELEKAMASLNEINSSTDYQQEKKIRKTCKS